MSEKGHFYNNVVRRLKNRPSVDCNLPFCPLCSNSSASANTALKPCLILSQAILETQPELLRSEFSKLYHILILQSILEKEQVIDKKTYSNLLNLCSDVFYNFSIYCDLFLENDKGCAREHKSQVAYGKASLEAHLQRAGLQFFSLISDEEPQQEGALRLSQFLSQNAPSLEPYVSARESPGGRSEPGSHVIFERHLSPSVELAGLPEGQVFVGSFAKRGNSKKASVNGIRRKEVGRVSISGTVDMNRAIDGDLVACVRKEEDPQAWKVVAVLRRNKQTFLGSIVESKKSSGSILFVPVQRKYPRFLLRSKDLVSLRGKRCIVFFDEWIETSEFPFAHLKEVLGDVGNLEDENMALLREQCFEGDGSFPSELEEQLRAEIKVQGKKIELSEEAVRSRRDLRSLEVFSIDPEGCVDIDDALHVRQLGKDFFEVGVHIADVTHYLAENSALDRIASERATSIYMVHKRIDMLPELLSANVCSLHAGVDRLAISIVFQINVLKRGSAVKVIPSFYGKTIIRSRKAYSYEEASRDLHDGNSAYHSQLNWLNRIAKILRKQRLDNGALVLYCSKPKFVLSEKWDQSLQQKVLEPVDSELYKTGETNELIEEFMLLANIAAGEVILDKFPSVALLRKHPRIDEARFEELKEIVADFSKKHSLGLSLETQADLPAVLKQLSACDHAEDLSHQVSKRMSRAVYVAAGEEAELGHFGLALPIYTHFTSPIRRYADVIVHRMLLLAAQGRTVEEVDRFKFLKIIENINTRYRMAKMISMKSVDLFSRAYLKQIVGRRVRASVVSVWDGGAVFFVKEVNFEMKLFVNENKEHVWDFVESEKLLRRGKMWKGVDLEGFGREVTEVSVFEVFDCEIVSDERGNPKLKVIRRLE